MATQEAQVKRLLKRAKQYLTEHEFEYCLDEIKEVLELDSKNYLAYIFNGKAYHSLNDTANAIKAYRKAIDIDNANPLAWKGLYLVYKNSGDYQSYFDFLQEYVLVLRENQEQLHELVRDVIVYNKKFNKNFADQNLHASYLRAILPNTPLGREIGLQIQPYEKSIEELLKLIRPLENKKEKDVRQLYPLNLTSEQQLKLNSALFNIYSKSEIPGLYNLLINSTRDDNTRHYYEDLQLIYDYDLIKVTPLESDKLERLTRLIDEIKGMITIRHPSQTAWYLYFDLVCSDYTNLSQLDLNELCWYVCNFSDDKGLASIIFGFLYSEISPFNTQDVDKKIQEYRVKDVKSEKQSTEVEKELDELEDADTKETKNAQITSDEILTYFANGSENSNDSLLGSRIVISYYIQLKEYLVASEKTRTAVRTLANLTRSLSIGLPTYKRFLLLSLATIYTYFEAPKNFARALELYERVEKEDPDDVTVKIGKGFILIEKGQIIEAKELLRDAVKSTRNRDAQIELSWCQIQSDEIEEGRLTLINILEQFKEADVNSFEKRAMILWRIAQSYLIEAKNTDNDESLIKEAYDCLIKSLKQSKTYAPSYTSLGLIYKDYYNNKDKAIKCFYKSFELDNSDLIASKELVSHYSELQEWPMCEVLCERVVTNENAKRVLTLSKVGDNSWPYRVLGICYLQLQQDAKSVEYFQNAIRLNKFDQVSWSCLGEAYYACGRYEAALKVYEHCLKLENDSSNWHTVYMQALVLSSLGKFFEAIEILESLLKFKSDELAVIKLYCQVLSFQSEYYISNGFIGRGINSCTKVIDIIHDKRLDKEFMDSQLVWKHLSQSLVLFLYSQASIEKLNTSKIEEIIEQVSAKNEFLAELEADNFSEDSHFTTHVIALLIKSSKNAIEVMPARAPRELRASIFYNLGINYLHAFLLSNSSCTSLLTNATKIFRKVLQLHDKDATYWAGLGITAFLNSDAALAQHSLIKSLALSPKDPLVWSDLAMLYMKYNDLKLSKETFTKVQALAPESNVGWLGNAMIEELTGDKEDAWRLFTHGFVLSNGRSTSAQILYSHSVIQTTVGSQDDKRNLDTIQKLSVANFAIFNYLKKFPDDIFAIQMALTIVERLGDYEKGVELCEKLCELLENMFESSEDENILLGFARGKSTLARLYLGDGKYDLALEAAQFALDLSEDSVKESNQEMMKIVLSARVVVGLSLFFTNDFNGALEQLKLILAHQQAQEDSESTRESLFVLISQILYSNGTEDSIQAALDELFTYIEENGSSLLVALTLGAMSIVENIEDILPAVKSDLLNLKLSDTINDNFRQIPYFIKQINKRLKINNEKNYQRFAFMFPNDMKVWEDLNQNMSLTVGSVSSHVGSDKLSQGLIKCGKLRQVQRGLFLNPSNIDGYKSLAICLKEATT